MPEEIYLPRELVLMAKDYAKYPAKRMPKRNNSGGAGKRLLILFMMMTLVGGWFYFNKPYKPQKAKSKFIRELIRYSDKTVDVAAQPQFEFYTVAL
jgi:hypothetical protein